jgi:hypothetical protein
MLCYLLLVLTSGFAPPHSTGWTKQLLWQRLPICSGQGAGGSWSGMISVIRIVPTLSTRRALEHTYAFDSIEHQASAWSLTLDPDQVVNLYSTYSNITIRPDREAVLAELRRRARDKFQGRVTRNMVTSLYMARRV